MKIKPANKFIKYKVSEFGEVVVVLGVRKAESATRAKIIKQHQKRGSRLSEHTTIPAAFIYSPIEDFLIDDVWEFLLDDENTPSPWGVDNFELYEIYKDAAGECPLVIDDTTPSCGNSRFGCWTCTVVKEDKSMISLINTGENWLQPMLELRNKLKETEYNKFNYRSHRRRSGKVTKKGESYKKQMDGKIGNKGNNYRVELIIDPKDYVIPGPYEMWFRIEILTDLLEIQKEVRKNGPFQDLDLITKKELLEIRRIWMYEEGDWADQVSKIYFDIYGDKLIEIKDDIGMFNESHLQILNQLCSKEEDVTIEMIVKLLSLVRAMFGLTTRPKVHVKINSILREDWISKNDLFDEIIKGEDSLNLGIINKEVIE
jgi:DNA sulfur modification protein DndC